MNWVEVGYYLAIAVSLIGVVVVFIPAMGKEIRQMVNSGKK